MATTADRPIAQMIGDIVGNVQHIVRAELRLARAELKEDVSLVRRAAVLGAIGALAGTLGLAFLCLAAVYALALVVPAWAAALIVAIVVMAAAALCFVAARRHVSQLGFPKTIATVQENVQWVQTHVD
jgi:membrane protein